MSGSTDAPALHRTQVGDQGPRVVFLHGLFGQGKNWTSMARALSPTARVTLLDLPDHGRSSWSPTFSYVGMAAQVAEVLTRDGGGEPYAVVGHSMGGKVAMALALGHPELVERLCVVDVSPVAGAQVGQFGPYVEGMRSIDLATLTSRAAAEAVLTPYAPDPTIRGFLLQNLRRESDPAGGSRWRWQMNLDLLGAELAAVGDWPDLDALPYPGPVLWLAGEHSPYIRPEYAPVMRTLFPRVRLVTVKNAGHWVHADQPEVFEAALRRFLHL
ncbi:MAG: putative hydrolase [Friedmanniella sp.]|nr:putative hydrolase [Friedmanniella sp.]